MCISWVCLSFFISTRASGKSSAVGLLANLGEQHA